MTTVTRLVVLVEDPSMGVLMSGLLPRWLPQVPVEVIEFQGVHDFMRNVPRRLAGLRYEVDSGTRIALIRDRDDEDCHALIESMRTMALAAGLTVDRAGEDRGHVLCRLACEELEAWFFGDVNALTACFPRVPSTLAERAAFRDPDDVRGGTWEQLHHVLQQAGHSKGRFSKREVALQMAQRMSVEHNRSRSFQVTMQGLRRLAEVA